MIGGLGKAVMCGYRREHVGVDGHMLVGHRYGIRELWGLVGVCVCVCVCVCYDSIQIRLGPIPELCPIPV